MKKTLIRLKYSAFYELTTQEISFSHKLVILSCSLILDNERWKQADVPSELQCLVDSLVDGENLFWFLGFFPF